ncbi:MAG: hypothetical protein LBE82_04650 [Chitinophagaceae bacterium]|nr:hypothetical protein [Chitinophagaceae bacterium]
MGLLLSPIGDSVRKSFAHIANPVKDISETVFVAIEKIHGFPRVSNLDIKQSNATTFDGIFNYNRGGRGIDIRISKYATNKEFTLLHELGHVIDNQSIGIRGFNESENAGNEFRKVLNSIEQTFLVKRLREIQQSGKREFNGRRIKIEPDDAKYLNYILNAKELWARAYAQYVVTKSGNVELLKQLADENKKNSVYTTQWVDDDFKNVIFEIDNLLIKNKWAKQLP